MIAGSTGDTPSPGRRLTLAELRERQLRILDAIASYCAAEQLRLFLCAGTLLGAVRHEGYIPWDDDLDVMLPRPDFERFCAGFGRRDGISVRSLATDATFALPFAKVCDDSTVLDVESDVVRGIGVNVDAFPLDGWSDRPPVRRFQRLAIAVLAQAMRAKHLSRRRARGLPRDAVLAAAKGALCWLPARRIAAALTWVARRGDFDGCGQVGVAVWGYHEMVPRAAYGQPSTVRFEGRDCPAPADPHTVLRTLYGDYLALPPEEQRVTRHRFVGYAVDPVD